MGQAERKRRRLAEARTYYSPITVQELRFIRPSSLNASEDIDDAYRTISLCMDDPISERLTSATAFDQTTPQQSRFTVEQNLQINRPQCNMKPSERLTYTKW